MEKGATPTERMVVRIYREAGATVRPNVFLKDMNVDVSAADGRDVEVLAQDLPCFGGVQLAYHVVQHAEFPGRDHMLRILMEVVLLKTRGDKETPNPELVMSGRCKLVVLAIETGGRWSAALPSKGARSSTVHALPTVVHERNANGHACLPSLAPKHLPPRWLSPHVT